MHHILGGRSSVIAGPSPILWYKHIAVAPFRIENGSKVSGSKIQAKFRTIWLPFSVILGRGWDIFSVIWSSGAYGQTLIDWLVMNVFSVASVLFHFLRPLDVCRKAFVCFYCWSFLPSILQCPRRPSAPRQRYTRRYHRPFSPFAKLSYSRDERKTPVRPDTQSVAGRLWVISSVGIRKLLTWNRVMFIYVSAPRRLSNYHVDLHCS